MLDIDLNKESVKEHILNLIHNMDIENRFTTSQNSNVGRRWRD